MKKFKGGRDGYKILNDGDPYPADFWNYLVNPITGYHVQARPNKSILKNNETNITI